jgi:hypothetical protein
LDHEPVLELNVSPSWAVPDTTGAAVFAGAGGAGAPATTLVGADAADVEPAASVAVTTERMVWPASAATSVKVEVVAPVMAEQDAPDELQVSHPYA